MQKAKDTFYLMLQARLAALNPARVIVLRGQLRPGIVVEENETPTAQLTHDMFRLSWTALSIDRSGALPLASMQCEIRYATDGASAAAGMDRGRMMAGMDAELNAALSAEPHNSPKLDCTATDSGSSPLAMATNIFWDAPVFSPLNSTRERLERVASLNVFAYQEAGEL
jgi:hypothetical protein